jgi:hypothetical protein
MAEGEGKAGGGSIIDGKPEVGIGGIPGRNPGNGGGMGIPGIGKEPGGIGTPGGSPGNDIIPILGGIGGRAPVCIGIPGNGKWPGGKPAPGGRVPGGISGIPFGGIPGGYRGCMMEKLIEIEFIHKQLYET